MRWIFLAVFVLLVGGIILFASSGEVDAAANLQGHRIGGFVAGMACFAVFSILVVGVSLLLAR